MAQKEFGGLQVDQARRLKELEQENAKLRVQWRHGDPIDLYIVRPSGVSRPPVIRICMAIPARRCAFSIRAFAGQ